MEKPTGHGPGEEGKKKILICKKLHCNSEHRLQKCGRINTGERQGDKVQNLKEELPRGM